MNVFKKLADTLIGHTFWSSTLTLVQLEKEKTGTQVSYVDGLTKDVGCVKKETSRKINNDVFEFFSEFFVSSKSVSDFDLDKNKLALVYNSKRYTIYDIIVIGTIKNDDAVVKFVVKR